MAIVIGLCGYAGAGKDIAATGLMERGFVRVAFADAVRELAKRIDPIVEIIGGPTVFAGVRLSDLILERGWDAAKKNENVRRLLQNLGTGARQVIGTDIWISAARRKFVAAENAGQNLVLTDVRFPNEAEAIYSYFGTAFASIVRITRPGVGPVNDHISETAIDDIEPDHTIVNDGTPAELRAKLIQYADSLAARV